MIYKIKEIAPAAARRPLIKVFRSGYLVIRWISGNSADAAKKATLFSPTAAPTALRCVRNCADKNSGICKADY